MRTCEKGACLKPAVYRGAKDEQGASAWCEEHAPATAGWYMEQIPSSVKEGGK